MADEDVPRADAGRADINGRIPRSAVKYVHHVGKILYVVSDLLTTPT